MNLIQGRTRKKQEKKEGKWKMSPIGTGIFKKVTPTRKPQIAGDLSPIPWGPKPMGSNQYVSAVA